MSAVLHALAAMTPVEFHLRPNLPPNSDVSDSSLPITSYPCQWKRPKKRKESNLPMSEARFHKHEFGKPKKRQVKSVEDFDPRPPEFRGKAAENLPTLLDAVRGHGLCISLLLDPRLRYWTGADSAATCSSPSSANRPSLHSLKNTVVAFKESLAVSDEKIIEIERDTRDQRNSSLWFSVRQFRLTSSLFGTVLHRKANTPPDSLVLCILQQKQFSSAATEWGIQNEARAIMQYIDFQHAHGHFNLMVTQSGFLINKKFPFLGASPDGAVYDPSSDQPFGFVEVKCPFSYRNVTPEQASTSRGFCSSLSTCGKQLTLRRTHGYYAQVQGQMAIGERPWCDFIVFTTLGISVERIKYESNYWDHTLLPKLISFYDNCVAPEIVSPIHVIGLPIRDLSKM